MSLLKENLLSETASIARYVVPVCNKKFVLNEWKSLCSLEGIVEVFVDLSPLGLEADGSDDGDDEESDEDPEDAVRLDRAVVAHQLRLAGPVAREEQSPGAHEQV